MFFFLLMLFRLILLRLANTSPAVLYSLLISHPTRGQEQTWQLCCVLGGGRHTFDSPHHSKVFETVGWGSSCCSGCPTLGFHTYSIRMAAQPVRSHALLRWYSLRTHNAQSPWACLVQLVCWHSIGFSNGVPLLTIWHHVQRLAKLKPFPEICRSQRNQQVRLYWTSRDDHSEEHYPEALVDGK